jgi:hypothetical protein
MYRQIAIFHISLCFVLCTDRALYIYYILQFTVRQRCLDCESTSMNVRSHVLLDLLLIRFLLFLAPAIFMLVRLVRYWYDTIRYDTIRYDTIRYDTIRYDTIRYDTIRYDTIRYESRVALSWQPLTTTTTTALLGKLWDRISRNPFGIVWNLLHGVAGLEIDLLRQCPVPSALLCRAISYRGHAGRRQIRRSSTYCPHIIHYVQVIIAHSICTDKALYLYISRSYR